MYILSMKPGVLRFLRGPILITFDSFWILSELGNRGIFGELPKSHHLRFQKKHKMTIGKKPTCKTFQPHSCSECVPPPPYVSKYPKWQCLIWIIKSLLRFLFFSAFHVPRWSIKSNVWKVNLSSCPSKIFSENSKLLELFPLFFFLFRTFLFVKWQQRDVT